MKHKQTIIGILAAAALATASIGAATAQRHHDQGSQNQQMQDRMQGQMRDRMQDRMQGQQGQRGPRAGMQGQMAGNMQGGMMGRMMHMMQTSRMMMGPMGPSMMMRAGRPSGDSLTADEARRIADGILAWQGNDRLKVGEVTEQDDNTILIEIMTVDDSLVQRIAMDRTTGMMQPAN